MPLLPERAQPRGRALSGLVAALLLLGGLSACTDDGSEGAKGGSGSPSKGDVIGSGDDYQATIRRTTDGVPHITGKTLPDAAFGQGYASGEDRTCDLADQVVKIRGERARWFGAGDEDANLNRDIQWRAIGMYDIAVEDWKDVPDDAKALFKSYAAGWNLHLEEVGVDDLPGWCAGEEWVRELEPVEVYAYARSISLNASGSRIGSFIATATPPDGASSGGDDEGAAAPSPAPAGGGGAGGTSDGPIASNGWAIGADRSTSGGGMLLGNPHFPWEGELRFWEVHLTVPGEVDAYGVQLSGVPGIGIGFTEQFGWTHTVSAGNRFTAYTLDLVPGKPTTYQYGDEEREMIPTTQTIEVLGDDGKVAEEEHTTWASRYGPIVDFPGFGWTEDQTITYRDTNVTNDEFIGQYFGMLEADSFDEFKAVHEEFNGIPLFNTIATSAEGETWYADTSATPNLSDEAEAAYEEKLATDLITQVAADNGAILLDGSDPLYEWVEVDGARDPGLVPFSEQPQISRDDYVFNANDSFWVPHATERLEGDYSLLHGRQQTPRTPRTRENATVLDDTTANGASGEDGTFDLDELADASLANRGFTSRALLTEVVARCDGAGPVTVPEVPADEDLAGLPAGTVDISAACEALRSWDGVYDLDRVGPPVWREFMSRFESPDLLDQGALWAEPFDPDEPIATPRGLAPAPDGGQADLVLEHLARAVQSLGAAGLEPDVTLGEAQFALRNGVKVPMHGGSGVDGTTNVVGFGTSASIMDPALDEIGRERVAVGSSLATIDDEAGYLINNGTSFLLALAYTDDGPQAKVFLAYSNTEDRSSKDYVAATERFSQKDWRTVAFTEGAIADDTISEVTIRG